MKLRSALMITLEKNRAKKWTQAEAPRYLGVKRARISDLMNGKINVFSLDTLVSMLMTIDLVIKSMY